MPILSQLLKAEMTEREVRSIAYQIKAARFPDYKDLTGFDFASSEVNEALVKQLHRGTYSYPGHFSMKIPGQLSAVINSLCYRTRSAAGSISPRGVCTERDRRAPLRGFQTAAWS